MVIGSLSGKFFAIPMAVLCMDKFDWENRHI